MLSRYYNLVSTERFLVGTSLFRIAAGLLLLYHYLIFYHQRYFLYSAQGVNDYPADFIKGTFSLYNFHSSLTYFDFIYHAGIVVAFLYLLGYKGRIISVINFVFYYSLYVRMFQISDGGDNIFIICLFFLLFANCSAYFSIDSLAASRRSSREGSFRHVLATLLHNFAVVCCIIQLCILYLFSGMYQLMGELWQNGTSMYYIAQVREFSRPMFRSLTENFLELTIVMSYASILAKFAFPFTIMSKRAKPIIVGIMVAFHIGIAMNMGLLSFSFVMIILELLVFTDQEYKRLGKRIVTHWRSMELPVRRRTRRWGYARLSSHRIAVFFDGWCPMCRGIKNSFQRMDYFRLLHWVNFRDADAQTYGIAPAELEQRMHSMSLSEPYIVRSGIHSFIQMTLRLPQLWLLVPALTMADKLRIGHIVYDYIASRRSLVPVNHCDEDSCQIIYTR